MATKIIVYDECKNEYTVYSKLTLACEELNIKVGTVTSYLTRKKIPYSKNGIVIRRANYRSGKNTNK